MKKLLLLLLFIPLVSFGQTLPKKISETEFSIGKSIKIESKILDEIRDLNIYLPLNYSSSSLKPYPVVYLLDGSKDEDFIHISGIVQFGSFSSRFSIFEGFPYFDRINSFALSLLEYKGLLIVDEQLYTTKRIKNDSRRSFFIIQEF